MKSKTYSYLTDEKSENKKAKSTKVYLKKKTWIWKLETVYKKVNLKIR